MWWTTTATSWTAWASDATAPRRTVRGAGSGGVPALGRFRVERHQSVNSVKLMDPTPGGRCPQPPTSVPDATEPPANRGFRSVVGTGVDPVTYRFSGGRSAN